MTQDYDHRSIRYGRVIAGQAEQEVGFYLADEFSMLPFTSAVEVLRIANRVARKPLYNWSVITADGQPVSATNGFMISANYAIGDAPLFSMLFVSGPYEPRKFNHTPSLQWIMRQAQKGIVIGGIETGTHILAMTNILNNIRCATHWENIPEFSESFPNHMVTSDVYEIEGNRVTCAGGSASKDMMLYIIEQQHGHELAAAIADIMVHPHIRAANEPQRMRIQDRIGVGHPTLIECIELMECNIEQPLSLSELSSLLNVSKRQLERLFRRYLNTTPARYYLILRLESARHALEKGAMKVIDVALACGFKSAGHFSSCYLHQFGMTPRESRKR